MQYILFLAYQLIQTQTKIAIFVQTGEKSRDDALEAIKGNLDGFSRDAKMHPTPSSQSKKPGTSSDTAFRPFDFQVPAHDVKGWPRQLLTRPQ